MKNASSPKAGKDCGCPAWAWEPESAQTRNMSGSRKSFPIPCSDYLWWRIFLEAIFEKRLGNCRTCTYFREDCQARCPSPANYGGVFLIMESHCRYYAPCVFQSFGIGMADVLTAAKPKRVAVLVHRKHSRAFPNRPDGRGPRSACPKQS